MYHHRNLWRIGAVLVSVLLASCMEGSVKDWDSRVPSGAIQIVQGLRVFFGHQSVGSNVLDGVRDMAGAVVHIVEVDSRDFTADEYAEPAIFHAAIGRNGFPAEKVEDFARYLREEIVRDIDVAFMKFCYVDAGHGMSASEIFDSHITEMRSLEAEFSETKFVYLTMPLTGRRTDIKGRIRRLVGVERHPVEENIERFTFNQMLREEVCDSSRLFDIARIESTHPDGRRETFRRDGQTYYAMVPAYTYDGGHLNERGRRIVAEELVRFLADL